jgi:hypothetical protein
MYKLLQYRRQGLKKTETKTKLLNQWWSTMLQAGRWQVRYRMRSLVFPIDLILPAAVWPWDWLSLCKWVPGIFLGGKGRPAPKFDNLTAICKPISRKCGTFEVSQTYGPPWPLIGIALPFMVKILRWSNSPPWNPTSCLNNVFLNFWSRGYRARRRLDQ